MDDLISRQAASDFIDAGHLCNPNEPRWSDNEVVNFLKNRPSAQRTGRWVIDRDSTGCMYGRCTSCGMKQYAGRTKYCPNCGAKMEVGE